MSSGAVLAWMPLINIPLLWKILSGLSATTAITLPFLEYETKIRECENLASEWSYLQKMYGLMLLDRDNGGNETAILERFKLASTKEADLEHRIHKLPEILSLKRSIEKQLREEFL